MKVSENRVFIAEQELKNNINDFTQHTCPATQMLISWIRCPALKAEVELWVMAYLNIVRRHNHPRVT